MFSTLPVMCINSAIKKFQRDVKLWRIADRQPADCTDTLYNFKSPRTRPPAFRLDAKYRCLAVCSIWESTYIIKVMDPMNHWRKMGTWMNALLSRTYPLPYSIQLSKNYGVPALCLALSWMLIRQGQTSSTPSAFEGLMFWVGRIRHSNMHIGT